MMQGVRDYLKFIKRGFGRTNHLANIDIRNKRLSREEGWELMHEYDGRRPASLDFFLDYLQITEEEFNRIASTHQVHPHIHKAEFVRPGKRLGDMDQWDRTLVDKPVGARDEQGKLKTYV
jgi:hypothetical protein